MDLVGQLQHYVAAVPFWLQVLVSYYLAAVLGSWALSRFSERRGLWLAVLCMATAAFLALRATGMLYAVLFERSG